MFSPIEKDTRELVIRTLGKVLLAYCLHEAGLGDLVYRKPVSDRERLLLHRVMMRLCSRFFADFIDSLDPSKISPTLRPFMSNSLERLSFLSQRLINEEIELVQICESKKVH